MGKLRSPANRDGKGRNCQPAPLEVAVEALGSDLAGEAAYIGLGFGMTSWVIQQYVGRIWLSLIGDRAGRRCEGWTVAVNSVGEATAKIAGMLATGWR